MSGKRSLVCGVGKNDWDSCITIKGTNKVIHEYNLWKGVLERVYSPSLHARRPSYKNSCVDPQWHSFKLFFEDIRNLIGYEDSKQNGWHLDKDILVKGNKLYSKDTCCFVPIEINSLLTHSKVNRGEYPVGVYLLKDSNKFRAKLYKNGRSNCLGTYSSPEEAFFAYKEAKEIQIKEVATKWKDQIDPRVYAALMNWEVEIDD